MPILTEITVRNIEKTPAIENNIIEKVLKVEKFNDRIESCKVVIEVIQNHRHNGKLFNVFIEILVPGKRLIVNRHPNENLYIAIRDAFSAMTQQLKDYSRKIKGEVKTHQDMIQGTITRLFADYGFIESSDGTEYYFSSENVMHPPFEELNEGMKVRFLDALPGDTPQASHIAKMNNNGFEFEEAA